MFVSFFPRPKLFFTSAAVWSLFGILLWMFAAKYWGAVIGLPNPPDDAPEIIGLSSVFTAPHIWFYIYYWCLAVLFTTFWFFYAPHRWSSWSLFVGVTIIFMTYFQVQLLVALNGWYGEFYGLIQKGLDTATRGSVSLSDLYGSFGGAATILGTYISVLILNSFVTSHFVFRWRTAMNDYFVANWQKLRGVEGAAQRVQEDCLNFARQVEDLGASFVQAVMTLIAFLPVLEGLSSKVGPLPFLGQIPHSLTIAAVIWSLFGTSMVALLGMRLPGLEFRNQRVEAAYRKELVYGEDHEHRANPLTLSELYAKIKKNSFQVYLNYTYFNLGRYLFLQADGFIAAFFMIPSIAAAPAGFSFGIFRQVQSAMGEVKEATQYLFRNWPDIIQLISIYKRLRIFEAAIEGNVDAATITADERYGRT